MIDQIYNFSNLSIRIVVISNQSIALFYLGTTVVFERRGRALSSDSLINLKVRCEKRIFAIWTIVYVDQTMGVARFLLRGNLKFI